MKSPSRTAVRTLTILSLIEAAVNAAGTHADPIAQKKIAVAKDYCQRAVDSWEILGSERSALSGAVKQLRKIDTLLNKIWWLAAKPDMNLPGMLYVSIQLLDDLMLLVTNRPKMSKLLRMFEAITAVINYVDPEGTMWLTQDRAKEVTDTIYGVIGER